MGAGGSNVPNSLARLVDRPGHLLPVPLTKNRGTLHQDFVSTVGGQDESTVGPIHSCAFDGALGGFIRPNNDPAGQH